MKKSKRSSGDAKESVQGRLALPGAFFFCTVIAVGFVGYSLGRLDGDPEDRRHDWREEAIEPAAACRNAPAGRPSAGSRVAGGAEGDADAGAERVGDVAAAVELAVPADPGAERNFAIREDIRQFILQEYAQLKPGEKSGEALKPFGQIREMGDRHALSSLREMVRNGGVNEKKAALLAIGAAYGARPGASAELDASGGDGAGVVDPSDEEAEAALTHDIVLAVQLGLEDPSPEVRQAAYESTMMLKEEEMGILTMQILSSGSDPALSQSLVADTAGSMDEPDLKVSMAALDSGDAKTRQAAAENLKEQLGQSFKTTGEALEWWEGNRLKVLDAVSLREPGEPETTEDAREASAGEVQPKARESLTQSDVQVPTATRKGE